MPRTRIAPTPSGFLHEGNRANISLIATLADEWGADIALRIDDSDASRYRREYVDDIFATLGALGVSWAIGPRDTDDFEAAWSQRAKTAYYRQALQDALEAGLPAYACACTRSTQRGIATGGCVGGCRALGLPLTPGQSSLRIAVAPGTLIAVGDQSVDIAQEMGDAVLWRRDDLPAYQLVSVIEDRDLAVTHIVRGEDLLASTAFQLHIAPWFEAWGITAATYVHHPLVLNERGIKLSKSTLSAQLPQERTP